MKAFKKSLGMASNGHDEDEDVAKAIKPGPVDQAFVRELEDAERRGLPQDLLGFCRSMSRHRGHADLQGRACRCLSTSGARLLSPSNHVSHDLGLLIAECVIGAMVSHKSNAQTIEESLRCVSILASHAEIRIMIAKFKGVKRILSAMDRHQKLPAVQETGCSALSTMAVSCDVSTEIQTAGGAKRILAAMDNHKNESRIQLAGCKAIRNLAVSADNRAQISSSVWGFKRILDAMNCHPSIADVQEQACVALANLTANNPASCLEVASAGGLEQIFSAMDHHVGSPVVQERACLCIRNLATIESIQFSIAQKGGIERTLRALKEHQMIRSLVSEGCRCIANLGRNTGNQTRIAQAGGVQALVACMDAFPEDSMLQEQATLALCNLGFFQRPIQLKIQEEGGDERVRTAMANANAGTLTRQWGQVLLDKIHSKNHDGQPISGVRLSGAIIAISVGGEAQLTQGKDWPPRCSTPSTPQNAPPDRAVRMEKIPLHVKGPLDPAVSRAENDGKEEQEVTQWAGAAGKVSPGGNVLVTPLTSPPETGPNTPA